MMILSLRGSLPSIKVWVSLGVFYIIMDLKLKLHIILGNVAVLLAMIYSFTFSFLAHIPLYSLKERNSPYLMTYPVNVTHLNGKL